MPDPVVIVVAMTVSMAVSAAVLLLAGWRGRPVWSVWCEAAWIVGMGAGFFAGCWLLEIRPHWPPREDQDRLLIVMLPAVVTVEVLAALPRVSRSLVWPLRLALLIGGGRVLLHGTSYLSDLTGPGTREWSPSVAWVILGSLAVLEGAVWALVSLLAKRVHGPSVSINLAVTTAGAAVTVMLSGYATGGQVGLPLAAAIMGSTVAALLLTRGARGVGPPGIAIVGLFSVLFIGRFFGDLGSVPAIALFCTPILGWIPELPLLNRQPTWVRGIARLVAVGTVVAVVLVRAQAKFDRDFHSPGAAGVKEPSFQDYLDFGK